MGKSKKAPATHLIQGIKAGGTWRIIIVSVKSQSVGASQHANVATALTNALARCADLEQSRKGKKHDTEWVVQNDSEIQFRNLWNERKGK